jgi:hypothetical protein
MTPHELTTLLAEPKGRQFDEPFKLMLLDRALVWYARLVRNTLERDPKRRKEFLRSVTMTLAGKDPRETTLEVPEVLYANGINFEYVGTENGKRPFIQTSSPSNMEFFCHNKYQKKATYYTFINYKIQLLNENILNKIRLDGVFLDPRVISKTNGQDPYEFMNTDMRIPKDIMQLIILSMEQNDLRAEPTKNNKDELEVTHED